MSQSHAPIDGLTIRNPRPDEAGVLARIESVCWPAGMAADEECFAARLQTWRQGQWAADFKGEVVGAATAQRITEAFLNDGPMTYCRLTDAGRFVGSHSPDGDIFHLITVSVLPKARGMRLGRRMVDHELAFARSLPGVRRILGFTRPAGYHRHQDVDIERYVNLRDATGRYVDPVLEFHLSAGARVVSIHPGYRPKDTQALGYGVLIEYPL